MLIPVFRIEHAVTGEGLFATESLRCKRLQRVASRIRYLPGPRDDQMYLLQIVDKARHFGAPSLYALKHWVCLRPTFEKNVRQIEQLDRLGFSLKEYLAELDSIEFGHSGLQLAFDRNACVAQGLVQTHSILNLISVPPTVPCLRDGKKRLWLPHVVGKDDVVRYE